MRYFKELLLFFFVISCPVQAQENERVVDASTDFSKEYSAYSALEGMNEVNDILYDILALTYENNPTIKAARAEFLVIQEKLVQAQSGYLPNLSADADVTYTNTEADGSASMTSDGGNTSKSASLNLNQPLYRGGSTQADIEEARNVIAAQQFSLSAIEQKMLYEAVVAYMDLYRDKAVLDLRDNNTKLVAQELEQAAARFHVGELTRTDVSQSEARLADAKAEVIRAQASVKTSIARFRQIVGNPPPINMGYPIIKFEIPTDLEAAIDLAQTNNRDILQARFNKQAATRRIRSIKGELLPQVSAVGRLDKVYDQSDFIDEQRQASIGVSASVPLYTGGATRSRIREAKKTALQNSEQINIVRESVRQGVIGNWESWEAARSETKARHAQVKAARIAQEGVHYETEFGERTTLDSLNANQELLSAQVELIKSKRDEIVAHFAIAQSLGLLVPQNLGFSTVKP